MIYDNTDPVNQTTVDAARTRLLGQIAARPVPGPEPKVETDAQTRARLGRQARLAEAQRVLLMTENDTPIAVVLNVSRRSIGNWRRGAHAPIPRNLTKLRAVRWLLLAVRMPLERPVRQLERRAQIVDRDRQPEAAD